MCLYEHCCQQLVLAITSMKVGLDYELLGPLCADWMNCIASLGLSCAGHFMNHSLWSFDLVYAGNMFVYAGNMLVYAGLWMLQGVLGLLCSYCCRFLDCYSSLMDHLVCYCLDFYVVVLELLRTPYVHQ